VVFDMDGVLVDGEPLHFRAVNELLAAEGRALTLDEYRPYMGTKAGWRELIAALHLTGSPEHYATRYNELILEQYRQCRTPLPGAVELARALRSGGMPLALASSSIAPWVAACLESLALEHVFDAVVTGSDVEAGKPAPDIYLEAARRLGLSAGRCLAIEDAPAGVASAVAAGMTCWAVRTEYTRGLPLPGAARVFESLADVDADQLLGRAAA
jgi:HAD superfamily hydrolase (TIGR01509 family)